jgi:RNA recognition motif-containing protein
VYEKSQTTSSVTFSHYIITADVGAAPVARRPAVQMPDEYLPPNKILFLQNLPESVTKDQLNALFSQYPNLHEVRLVPSKKDIAFVEYLDEGSATVAKDALHNYKLDGENKIKVRIFAQTFPSLITFRLPRSPSPENKYQGRSPRRRPRFQFANDHCFGVTHIFVV